MSFDTPATGIQWNGASRDYGLVQYGSDEHLIVMFYKKAVHNAVKSQQHGAPVSEDMDFVKMHPPGERLNIIDRPVKDDDKRRFPRQWTAYQHNHAQECDGIPIELLFPTHPAIGVNLRSAGVHTIEQCANMSGHAMDTIGMGAQDYMNRAKTYLDVANGGKGYHDLKRANEDKDRMIRQLQEQVTTLQGQMQQLSNAVQGGHYLVPGAMMPTMQPRFPDPTPQGFGQIIQAQRQANDAAAGLNQAPQHNQMADLPATKISNPFGKKQHDADHAG